jgi:hypothetical protein
MNSTINLTNSDDKFVNSIENFTDNTSLALFCGVDGNQENCYLSCEKNAFA